MKKTITVEFEHGEKKMRFAHEGATITNDDGEEIGSVRPMLDGGQLGEPQALTARNAVASTFGLRGEQYEPIFET